MEISTLHSMNLDLSIWESFLILFHFIFVYGSYYISKQLVVISKIKKGNPPNIYEKVISYLGAIFIVAIAAFVIAAFINRGINYSVEIFLVLLPVSLIGIYSGWFKYSSMTDKEKLEMKRNIEKNRGSSFDM